MRLPLIGGAYSTRSIIASAQRCVNLYPEVNRKDALTPTTHYQRPGLRPLSNPPIPGIGQGLFHASNGAVYAVVANNLYFISPIDYSFNFLGSLTPNIVNPVSMADNGVTLVLVDGSPNGYAVTLASNSFQGIVDSTGTFQGAVKADYIDTFLLFGPSPPGSNQFISTTSSQVQFNGLYVGGKTDYPDPMVAIIVNNHEVLVFGTLKSEIWYDAGNSQFPLAELPGAFIEHGVVAPYSIAASDISVFWLGQDLQGQGVVFRRRGYLTTVISNHALSYALRAAKRAGASLQDAIGYTYQLDGHYFYVLTLPQADMTWVFDDAISDPTLAWHQRGWTDVNGTLHRDRVMSFAHLDGVPLGLDWQYGTLYMLDPLYYYDTVNGVNYAIEYRRTFPKIGNGADESGQLVEGNGKLLNYTAFIPDVESGNDLAAPNLRLAFSDDRGKTFTGVQQQTLGGLGNYGNWPTFRVLGMARDRVFELSWQSNGEAALNGAWVDVVVQHN
jgi:hypothetical protein